MIYIINDEVRFNSSSNKLTSLLTSEEVILTYPAGKCLKLLLDNAYSVVSHNQFFEKSGAIAVPKSQPTLYIKIYR